MSYRLKIDPKSRFVARFMSRVQKAIQEELIESGKTQQEISEIIGVNRSVINRRLSSDANLTSRSIAEFAYAFGKDLDVKFVKKVNANGANSADVTDSIVDLSQKNNAPSSTVLDHSARHFVSRVAL